MARTRFGLLGRRLSHSYSPLIHEYLGRYTYPLFEKEPEEVAEFVRSGPFDGLNVTIPYKQTVLPLCDRLSAEARAIGSVNTLLRWPDGTLSGDNTDFYGFSRMVAACGVNPKGKKVLVLGSGGSSLTARAVLRALGADPIVVISRSGPDNYTNLDRHSDARMIVNTTPVGMYPNVGVSPLDLRAFPRCEAVLDLIYNPARTDLILQAEALGIPCQNGLTMLVAQAKRAAELFLEQPVPDALIDSVRAQVARRSLNLTLIGMPGCGKSSIGRVTAQRLERPFVDLDARIVQAVGKPIPEIFAQDGEEVFRRIEHEVLTDVAKKSGQVIATGGGVVTRPENRAAIARNSVCVYLRRDIATLSTKGRPLSQSEGVAALFEQRRAFYESWSDMTVDCLDCAPNTAQALVRAWNTRFDGQIQ